MLRAPPSEDICSLEKTATADLVELLRRRTELKRPYTMCRDVCVSINPLEWLPLYDDATQASYAAKTTRSAHIYIVAQQARVNVMKMAQTIVITGESGAGKTETTKILMG